MSALADLGVVDAADAIRDRTASPVELVEAALERIAAVEEDVNGFITVAGDAARAQARERERQALAGEARGPLHGVPIAVKDNIDTAGLRTTAGSAILADRVPAEDAAVVRAVRDAGAIVIGKTNLHEFAWGVTTENPHHGTTHNPWDRERFVAGSSGGSAAAVASRAAPGALGTDTGGSICLPAAMCGVTGLRPTIGRVSNRGTIPLAWSMDTVGPIARSAVDCAALLHVLAGHDPGDPGSADAGVPDYVARIGDDVAGLTVGIPSGLAGMPLQAAVRAAFETAVEDLRAQGVGVVDVGIPDLDEIRVPWLTVMLTEASAYHAHWLRTDPDAYGGDVRTLLDLGSALGAVDYVQAQRFRSHLRERLLESLRAVDALLLPTAGFTATPVGARKVELAAGEHADLVSELTRFACVASAAGLPALSVPCGFDGDRLPIGMQLVGRPFAEDVLLRLGHAYEQATAWPAWSPLVCGALR